MTTTGATRTMVMTAAAVILARTNVAAEGERTIDTAATRRIVVSIPDRKLALIENDQIVVVYPVAVGAAASPTPAGTFSIVNRVSHPTYYKPGKVVGPGASNPIGTRWIGLSAKGFGIHGTDNPGSNRPRQITRLHPAAQPGRRAAVRARAARRRRGALRRTAGRHRAVVRSVAITLA